MIYLTIGSLLIAVSADFEAEADSILKKEYLHPALLAFESTDIPVKRPDISIMIRSLEALSYQADMAGLLSSEYMTVYKTGCGFVIAYNQSPGIHRTIIDTIEQSVTIYTRPDAADNCEYSFTEQLSMAIRDAFFTLCPEYGLLPLHSSSVVYKDKAYVFSAPSGTGKTTHTNLWLEHTDARMLDGDVCLLAVRDNKAVAYGLPWCGSSGLYENGCYELGKVFFLKRSSNNRIEDCSPFQSIINMMSRSFASNWTSEHIARINNIATSVSGINPAAMLYCTPDVEALNTVLDYLAG